MNDIKEHTVITYQLTKDILKILYKHNTIKHPPNEAMKFVVDIINLYMKNTVNEFDVINEKIAIIKELMNQPVVSLHYAQLISAKINNVELSKILEMHEAELTSGTYRANMIRRIKSGEIFDEYIEKIRNFRKYKKID